MKFIILRLIINFIVIYLISIGFIIAYNLQQYTIMFIIDIILILLVLLIIEFWRFIK